jgi:hypothetical protein
LPGCSETHHLHATGVGHRLQTQGRPQLPQGHRRIRACLEDWPLQQKGAAVCMRLHHEQATARERALAGGVPHASRPRAQAVKSVAEQPEGWQTERVQQLICIEALCPGAHPLCLQPGLTQAAPQQILHLGQHQVQVGIIGEES